jgi:C-terminal processing protease CtpA/Prc
MTRIAALFLCVLLALPARADGPTNLTFEQDTLGRPPAGWFVPGPAASAGWKASIRSGIARREGNCVVLSKAAARTGGQSGAFGNLMQQFDATPFQGKRISMTAWIRVKPDNPQAGGRAQMWFRADRPNGQTGFFDNSSENPATSTDWQQYKIIADIDQDAQSIAVGFMAFGATTWIDDVTFDVIGDAVQVDDPPRPLTEQGLMNLTAFAKLVGYVRYYHPSDEAAACDWEEFVRARVTAVESAPDSEALADEFEGMLAALAPSAIVQMQPFGGAFDPRSMLAEGDVPRQETAWFRYGFAHKGEHGIYQAQRRVWQTGEQPPEFVVGIGEHKTSQIAPGVWVRIPLAVYRDDSGTLPRARLSIMPTPDSAYVRPSGDHRTTRLAAVILAWNVFQHHYPYFDVVGVNWEEQLSRALRDAATDPDGVSFHRTLERFVASLEDGHGYVGYTQASGGARLPIAWSFVGERLIVTEVGTAVQQIREGDEVLEIDGIAVAELATAAARRMSASTPQFRRYRTANELARGEFGQTRELKLRRMSGEMYTQQLECGPADAQPAEPRPDKVCEVRPGIWYVDIDRVNDDDIRSNMDRLAAAEGLVFDLRGYPGRLSTIVLAHLTDTPLRSARWCAPYLPRPDREGMSHANGGWPVPPAEPRWTSNAAFIIDGRAISYAETYMGIVEHFKLAAIVGEATAGTNGNVTSFSLPGGYSIGFTGMRVLKHDGSVHHGIGIEPTIPVERTIEGIAADKDEFLEAAIAHVEKHAPAKERPR